MSELTHIPTPAGLAPGNGYSHVVHGEGHFVAISGQIALDEQGNVVGPRRPRGAGAPGLREPAAMPGGRGRRLR